MKKIASVLKIVSIGSILLFSSCGETKNGTNNNDSKITVAAFENYEKTVGGPQILFSEYEHDFGTVSKDNNLEHTFYFVNSGDAPLVITNAKGSCGCTIPEFETDPINPGEQSKIEVEIDPSNKLEGQVFQVMVRVESNAKDPLIKLTLKGTPQESK